MARAARWPQAAKSGEPVLLTAVQVHLEKLPDAAAREAMRQRWREALERIVAELA